MLGASWSHLGAGPGTFWGVLEVSWRRLKPSRSVLQDRQGSRSKHVDQSIKLLIYLLFIFVCSKLRFYKQIVFSNARGLFVILASRLIADAFLMPI